MKMYSNLVISTLLLMGSIGFFFMYIYVSMNNKCFMLDYEILIFNSKSISMNIFVDWMSSSFLSFVFLISFVVVIYSWSYMSGDKSLGMFIFLVFMFVMSMLLLIISPNLISILLGWDGLGLISYCLVIYYQNTKSYNAGMVTAMSNRIGDVMILLCIAWMMNFGSWNYMFYFVYEKDMYVVIGALIIVAAMTKSAQIPFSSWLPAAMAAPTPVSALVHSSTLVTAGVYLLIRFNFIFENFMLCKVLLMLSVLTMFMAGLGAIFENDLKKIIALSTLSQLGLMISSLCLNMVDFAFFHLLTHALFKSLLFMCAGYIIHSMKDSQDIRFMGSIVSQSPLLSTYFNMSNLALCGAPFLAGFYSKDLILETLLMQDMNYLIFILYFMSTFFTVVYTFRLIYFSMINSMKLSGYHSLSDNDYIMLGIMMVMMLMVIIGGSFMSWMIFIDLGGIVLMSEFKMLTLTICVLGAITGYSLGKINLIGQSPLNFIFLKSMLGEMWFLPYLTTYSINYIVLKIGYYYFKYIDMGWGEFLGGQGINKTLLKLNNTIYLLQKKNLFFLMFMNILLLAILMVLSV
uniref:NADH-ubiquinone oxidoreductase chain 5 n=1 Tax=Eolachesilla chilensis TaxID=297977 RepID=A0A8K1ZFE9_9NEOP|nr:NADH dehydrogenase subunit 5 [Eolachesilla chilensis]